MLRFKEANHIRQHRRCKPDDAWAASIMRAYIKSTDWLFLWWRTFIWREV